MKWAIFYTLLALILAVLGIIKKEIVYPIGAVIVGTCAYYWIWKVWGK